MTLAILLSATTLAWAPTIDQSPQPRIITDTVSCGNCRIERYLVATIADSLYPGGALDELSQVHRMPNGRFIVQAGGFGADELYVTDSVGNVRQRIGRTGGGPGEFVTTDRVEETTSAILVLDQRLRRVTRLSKEDLSLISISPLPAWSRHRHVNFPDGRYAFSGLVPTSDRTGFPVHLASPEGVILKSFGGRREFVPGTKQRVFERVLAASQGGSLWVALTMHYQLEQWDTAGKLLMTYQRRTDWFPPLDTLRWKREDVMGLRLAPVIMDVHEGDDGLLWIYCIVPVEGGMPPGSGGPSDASHSVIEVIDPAHGRIVASLWIRNWLGFTVGGGFYQSSYRTSKAGEPLIDVWGFRLVR